MRFSSYSLLLSTSLASASSTFLQLNRLGRRQIVNPSDVPPQCEDICNPSLQDQTRCGFTPSCICTSTVHDDIETCADCIAGVEPDKTEELQAGANAVVQLCALAQLPIGPITVIPKAPPTSTSSSPPPTSSPQSPTSSTSQPTSTNTTSSTSSEPHTTGTSSPIQSTPTSSTSSEHHTTGTPSSPPKTSGGNTSSNGQESPPKQTESPGGDNSAGGSDGNTSGGESSSDSSPAANADAGAGTTTSADAGTSVTSTLSNQTASDTQIVTNATMTTFTPSQTAPSSISSSTTSAVISPPNANSGARARGEVGPVGKTIIMSAGVLVAVGLAGFI